MSSWQIYRMVGRLLHQLCCFFFRYLGTGVLRYHPGIYVERDAVVDLERAICLDGVVHLRII